MLHMQEIGEINRAKKVQLLCLLTVLAMEALLFLTEDREHGIAWYILERYLTIPAMIFLGTAISRSHPQGTKGLLILGGAVMAWFIAVQIIHQSMGMGKVEFGTVACVYGLALPFAAVTEDAERQWGLRMTGLFFLAVGALLLAYGGMLMLGVVPEYLKRYVSWDGARFNAMGHPNECAALLMIGMAFSAGFSFRVSSRWGKGVLAVLTVAQFVLMSLTNSRTTVILTCMLMGGIVFCALRRTGSKRFVLALVVGISVIAGMFLVSQKLFKSNEAYRTALAQQSVTEQVDAPRLNKKGRLVTGSPQGSLKGDMKTLNGRTRIWRAIRKSLNNDDQIRVVGTEYVDLLMERGGLPFVADHAHNSWLQLACRRGTTGLLLALVITVMALWDAAVLLWRNTDVWKSCIALLTLCLLGNAMLEPYLFNEKISYHYFDFLFMMCVGYMHLWYRREQQRVIVLTKPES